ncbi:SAM-dependent methyltransferase [Pseudooceanicola antarcticus]|nr:SAM-dependent methyltransferase [Pseudooceanicola antarcticus]
MHTADLARSGYVGAMRRIERGARFLGVIALLERLRGRSRLAHWMLTLFSIHDMEGLVALDVPWWSYDAIERVEAFLAERDGAARVFEYGAGAGTIWLARRAAHVTSIEHHAGWGYQVQGLVQRLDGLAPVDLRLVFPDSSLSEASEYIAGRTREEGNSFRGYARSIETDGESYDLIVIGGRARIGCLKHAVPRLAPGGMIVFRNTQRARYRSAIAATGLRIERYRGLSPSLPIAQETVLLISDPA